MKCTHFCFASCCGCVIRGGVLFLTQTWVLLQWKFNQLDILICDNFIKVKIKQGKINVLLHINFFN